MAVTNNGGYVGRETPAPRPTRRRRKRERAGSAFETSPRKRSRKVSAARPNVTSTPRFAADSQVGHNVEILCGGGHQLTSNEEKGGQSGTKDPPRNETILTKDELAEACLALKLKLDRDKNGHRQCSRRLRSQPFTLSASQKLLMATSYRTARYDDRAVDYERIAASIHFKTFKGHVQALRSREGPLLSEMKAALTEQRRIEADESARTVKEWKEELLRSELLHQQERDLLQNKIKLLEERRSAETTTIECLHAQLALLGDENKSLRKANEGDVCAANISKTLERQCAEIHALKERVDQQLHIQRHIQHDVKQVSTYLHVQPLQLRGNKLLFVNNAGRQMKVTRDGQAQPEEVNTVEERVQSAIKRMHLGHDEEQLVQSHEERANNHELSQLALWSNGMLNAKHDKVELTQPTRIKHHHRDEAIQVALEMTRY